MLLGHFLTFYSMYWATFPKKQQSELKFIIATPYTGNEHWCDFD